MADGRPVLTVTLNPALDVTYEVDGVNWSDQTAGETRRTFVVLDTRVGQMASFYERGPQVELAEFAAFLTQYQRLLDGCAAVVLSGSLPPGLLPDAYGQLISMAAAAGVPSVLDTGGQSLRHGVAAGPDIAKPNLAELEAWSGGPLRSGNGLVDHAVVAAAGGGLRRAGAKSAVISLGADGLVAVTQGRVWRARMPAPVAGNATGAGDAAAAGLALWLAGWLAESGWADALRYAAALGAATVASPVAGEFSAEVYQQALAQIVVTSAESER